jgi:hypothetical protein
MTHVSNVGVLEIVVYRDRSMSVERKVQFGEEDIPSVPEAPLLHVLNPLTSVSIQDYNQKTVTLFSTIT